MTKYLFSGYWSRYKALMISELRLFCSSEWSFRLWSSQSKNVTLSSSSFCIPLNCISSSNGAFIRLSMSLVPIIIFPHAGICRAWYLPCSLGWHVQSSIFPVSIYHCLGKVLSFDPLSNLCSDKLVEYLQISYAHYAVEWHYPRFFECSGHVFEGCHHTIAVNYPHNLFVLSLEIVWNLNISHPPFLNSKKAQITWLQLVRCVGRQELADDVRILRHLEKRFVAVWISFMGLTPKTISYTVHLSHGTRSLAASAISGCSLLHIEQSWSTEIRPLAKISKR